VHRTKTYYKDLFSDKQPEMNTKIASDIMKARADFNLASKFKVGYDEAEGPAAGGKEKANPE